MKKVHMFFFYWNRGFLTISPPLSGPTTNKNILLCVFPYSSLKFVAYFNKILLHIHYSLFKLKMKWKHMHLFPRVIPLATCPHNALESQLKLIPGFLVYFIYCILFCLNFKEVGLKCKRRKEII